MCAGVKRSGARERARVVGAAYPADHELASRATDAVRASPTATSDALTKDSRPPSAHSAHRKGSRLSGIARCWRRGWTSTPLSAPRCPRAVLKCKIIVGYVSG